MAMDGDFWRAKWRNEELGWHRATPNPMLVRHVSALGLRTGARVFVPLCGKTVDIGWLRDNGCRVVAVELVESAVKQLFAGLGLAPEIRSDGALKRYVADGVDVFVGDLFDLDAAALGEVDAVYDRAALVALPPETRVAYAARLAAITVRAPQLLVTFDYDQNAMNGPPFSVTDAEVAALYGVAYDVERLQSAEVEGGLKGFCPATETVWSLT